MTTPSLTAVPGIAARKKPEIDRARPWAAAVFRLLPQMAGAALALAMVAALELLQRPAGVEPVALVPLVVVAAAIAGGFMGGAAAAAVLAAYTVFYYAQPEWSSVDGNEARVVITFLGSSAAVWLIGTLRGMRPPARAVAIPGDDVGSRLHAFTLGLASVPDDALPDALVGAAAALLDADVAVLTVLEPLSGRHFVRAVHGGGDSAIGVEVIPGVGVTGKALRERRTVIEVSNAAESRAGGADAGAEGAAGAGQIGRQRPHGAPQVMAAVPALQQGRVIATLTVGRSDPRRPFDAGDVYAMDLVSPIITVAVSGQLQRQQREQGSPRDAQTGLYNRSYLDAALDQLLALRRRIAPPERPPLSMIMFDVDGFRLINERHGRQVGDAILRAVATLLRQRFRSSDVVARVGPDSFFVVLNGASAETAAEAAAQMRRQVRELNLANAHGEPVVVSISAGCALFRDGERPEALFRSVEAALDTARWSGPGAVVSI